MKLTEAAQDKIEITNAGINGHNTANLLSRLEKDVLVKNPELVILMVGTNDMLNLDNILSVTEYKQNYRELIGRIKEQAVLILMTIPPINAEYLLVRVGPDVYGPDGSQGRVESANAVIRNLATEHDCHLIDLYHILLGCGGSGTDENSLFMNEANAGINDGVHPTVQGYRVIATAVYQTIITLKIKASNIVCFGDSITYGYKTEGEGTTQGQPYPAVLNRLLNR